jgi:hypothetical protein
VGVWAVRVCRSCRRKARSEIRNTRGQAERGERRSSRRFVEERMTNVCHEGSPFWRSPQPAWDGMFGEEVEKKSEIERGRDDVVETG